MENTETNRCVIIVDQTLPAGRSANAAAVIALTMGAMWPELMGKALVDSSGFAHPGLIPIGISILGADAGDLPKSRTKALDRNLGVVDFPASGQETTDYEAFGATVAAVNIAELRYVGIGIYGERKAVGKIVGKFSLLA